MEPTESVSFMLLIGRRILLPIIAVNVAQGSTIVSDGWATYGGINNLQLQYNHQWINHRVNFVDSADSMVNPQGIDATWGALKTSLRHFHVTNKDMLPSYFYQYMFRRFHNNKIFQHILEEMRIQFPV